MSDAKTVYVPGVRLAIVYRPSGPVVALRTAPVALFVALTVAPSRTTPLESRTTPVMRPVGVCANAGIATSATARTRRTECRRRQSMQSSRRIGLWDERYAQ